MKYSTILGLLFVIVAAFIGSTQAGFCPCDLTNKEKICGSNGVTYKNRCEFECTQRDYKKLGRTLNAAKTGPCNVV